MPGKAGERGLRVRRGRRRGAWGRVWLEPLGGEGDGRGWVRACRRHQRREPCMALG